MTPSASYVICATPRTGSYLLCDALDATGVAGHPTEHLSGTYQGHWQSVWGTNEYADYLAQVFTIGTTPNGVFGTKLHRHQLDHFLRQLTGERDVEPRRARPIIEEVLPRPRWIYLSRRDALAQAISYTRSMQTEIWWDADTDPAPSAPPRPAAARFDFAQIEAYARRLRTWDRRWRSWFEQAGITPLHLTYEQLTHDLSGIRRKVLDYLDLELPPDLPEPVARVRRQADERSVRWTGRFEALRHAKAERTLTKFTDIHRGEPIVVCGCGTSLHDLDRTNERITIGVNDVDRAFPPSYLVVVDNPSRFDPSRWEHVRRTRADVLFTNQFLDIEHPFIVRMALRERNEPSLPGPTSSYVLGKPWYSPYVALSLAGAFGGDPLGMIGVDFADDHFFARTGPYPGIKHLPIVNDQFRTLRTLLVECGRRVANLGGRSRIDAFPALSLADFDRLPTRRRRLDRRCPLNVVVYDASGTAVGSLLARAIWGETGDHARCLHGSLNPRSLAWPDVDWTTQPDAALAELAIADVVVTVGAVLPEHRSAVESRPHASLEIDVNRGLRLQGAPVPAPLPLWSSRLLPEERDGVLTVLLAPGDDSVRCRSEIQAAATAAGRTLRLVDAAEDSPDELHKLRRRAHAVVDFGGSQGWLWSLAGLVTGAVVINDLAGSSRDLQLFQAFSGAWASPFVHADRRRLDIALRRLFSLPLSEIDAQGAQGRRWVTDSWSFAQHWERWWLPVLSATMRAGSRSHSDE